MMLDQGFIQEVQKILDMGYQDHLKPMQSIGYKHITDYLLKRTSLNESVRLMKRDTRRYAKRQMTWFRNDSDIKWFNSKDTEGIMKCAKIFLNAP